eukprot:710894-Ditylum_brightwellii.AAC.1
MSTDAAASLSDENYWECPGCKTDGSIQPDDQNITDPVDTEACTDYLSVVKTPMDYSTLCANLINGKYFRRMKSTMLKMEEEQQQETNATTLSSFPKENNEDGEKKNKISNEEAMQKSEKALDDAIYFVLRDL